jgi:hypothetical protein
MTEEQRAEYLLKQCEARHLSHKVLQMSVFTFLSQYSHMASYMWHCQGKCQERRHARILATPNKDIDKSGRSTKNIVYRDVLEG